MDAYDAYLEGDLEFDLLMRARFGKDEPANFLAVYQHPPGRQHVDHRGIHVGNEAVVAGAVGPDRHDDETVLVDAVQLTEPCEGRSERLPARVRLYRLEERPTLLGDATGDGGMILLAVRVDLRGIPDREGRMAVGVRGQCPREVVEAGPDRMGNVADEEADALEERVRELRGQWR